AYFYANAGTTVAHTLSLHDALPISLARHPAAQRLGLGAQPPEAVAEGDEDAERRYERDAQELGIRHLHVQPEDPPGAERDREGRHHLDRRDHREVPAAAAPVEPLVRALHARNCPLSRWKLGPGGL